VEVVYKLAETSGALVGRGDELDRALAAIEAGAPARDLESGTLEFKEQAKSHYKAISDVVDAVLCLVNGAGGIVAVGISNTLSGPQAFRVRTSSQVEAIATARAASSRRLPT